MSHSTNDADLEMTAGPQVRHWLDTIHRSPDDNRERRLSQALDSGVLTDNDVKGAAQKASDLKSFKDILSDILAQR